MKTRCVIIAGGDCDVSLLSNIGSEDYVIAADSGLQYCHAVGIVPDLLVGDFDSYTGPVYECTEVIKLPTHKDDTDLFFAARCGVERGFRKFAVFGGYGSRPDQNMAMFQTLHWLTENCEQPDIRAVCNGFEVFAVKNSKLTFSSDRERYLSVFAVGGTAYGVDIVGAEYPLNNATVTPSFPIGVSNVAVNDTTVSVRNGMLLIMTVDKNI